MNDDDGSLMPTGVDVMANAAPLNDGDDAPARPAMTGSSRAGIIADVSLSRGRVGPAPVESELSMLLGGGYSRTDATKVTIERVTTEAWLATTVVLVEGLSDQIALEVLAGRQVRALRADGTFIVPTGGATNFARLLTVFGPHGRDLRLTGLYDSPVENRIRRSLEALASPAVTGEKGWSQSGSTPASPTSRTR